MDSNSPKTTNESCISTTGTPASQRYSDNIDNVKYINQDPVKPNKAAPNKILPTTLPLNGLDKR
ncbi:hypothetical protein DOY81_012534 [Sarcophaga bullata]|nr:hypothetical protein DOY81_012534 [Sarcophaga bullata]